jgi:hypothetical protein
MATPSVNPKLTPQQVERLQGRIQRLEALLDGPAQISGDKNVSYDMIAIRKRLRDAYRQLYPDMRPRISSVYLGGF